MMIPDSEGGSPMLAEATRELEAAIHDARVAFDCIGLGELDRAHTSAVTARTAIDAAVTAVQAALTEAASQQAGQTAATEAVASEAAATGAAPVRRPAGDLIGVLREVAAAHEASPAQIALAWVIRHLRRFRPVTGRAAIPKLAQARFRP